MRKITLGVESDGEPLPMLNGILMFQGSGYKNGYWLVGGGRGMAFSCHDILLCEIVFSITRQQSNISMTMLISSDATFNASFLLGKGAWQDMRSKPRISAHLAGDQSAFSSHRWLYQNSHGRGPSLAPILSFTLAVSCTKSPPGPLDVTWSYL